MAAIDKAVDANPTPQVGIKDLIEAPPQVSKENAKESPLGNLLEKLRAKTNQYKPWGDMAKALRMALTEKHHLIDNTERSQLQRCLDTIQKSMKVSSMQGMVERLDTITRQQGLIFSAGPGTQECFISSDMFYVEVLLEPSGEVRDVKISHHGDPVSCPELTEVLRHGDFAEFTSHLEGLASIYQLNADKKQKTKAYLALQALETDLSILSQLQSFMNEPSNLVHKSPVGILQPRKGGHPMKLTFFISPYDLLDLESRSSIPLTVDAILEKQLGHSVFVCIESSSAHKLQTVSLITVTVQDGKSLPSFAALSNLNSTTLPASFVLKLPKPIPMALVLVRKIQTVTNIECADTTSCQPLLSLIITQASDGKLSGSSDRGLNVTLPDQHHCYYLTGSSELQGVMVSGVPFTHPTHVPQILVFLRQQLLFNSLIASCVRPSSRQNLNSSHKFEVNTTSISNISISFEHPLDESLATVDLNLDEITNVKCRIYTLNSDINICTDEYASKVVQRCLSIPVTMRAVIRKAQGQQMRLSSQTDSYYSALNSSGPSYLPHLPGYGGGGTAFGGGGSGGDFGTNGPSKVGGTKTAADGNVEPESPLGDLEAYDVGDQQRGGTLGNILGQTGGNFPQGKGGAPNMMLMSMLSDVPAANSPTQAVAFPFLGQPKPRKQRKRKGTLDGRSPKRKPSEDEALSLTPCDLDDTGGLSLQFEGTASPFPKMENVLHGEPFLESEAGQGKMPSSLLNPAESGSADGFSGSQGSDSFLASHGDGYFPTGEGASGMASGREGETADGGDQLSSRLQCRKLKRLKSDDGTRLDMREELKLEREGSRSLDSGPKNLHSGGDLERVSAQGTKPRTGSPPVTSFKIEKSGDGLKISKSDGKPSKAKDLDARKRADARKERKRKRMEEAELTPEGQVAVLHGLPPDAAQISLDMDAGGSFNLSAKASQGPIRSIPGNKKSSGSASPSVSSGQRQEKLTKPSPPGVQASSTSQKLSDHERKSPVPSSGKSQKHKSGTVPQKSSSSGTNCTGNLGYVSPVHGGASTGPSPSKLSVTKSGSSSASATLKLKNINLPSSTTITPVAAKSSPALPSPTSSAPPSITIMPATSVTSVPSGNNMSRPPKSRKGSLSAVIAKLTNTAAAPVAIEALPKVDPAFRVTEKKDGAVTVPKDLKEKEAAQKNPEGKMKYTISDQFTVKQGSGIKLTVTKTSGVYKSSSKTKTQVSSSKAGLSSPKVKSSSSPSGATRLMGNPGTLPSKKSPSLSSSSVMPATTKTSGQGKSSHSPQRTFSPSTVQQVQSSSASLSTRVTSSSSSSSGGGSPSLTAMSASKVQTTVPKQSSSSGPSKTSPSVRSAEKKPEPARALTPTEKVSSTLEASLMPPPPQVGTTPKEELEECFRSSVTKPDAPPLDQWPLTKPAELLVPGDLPEYDEKIPRVSSSTDARPSSATKNGPENAVSSDLARFDLISTTLEESVAAFKAQRPPKPKDSEESSPEDELVIDFPELVDRKGASSRGQSPKVDGGAQEPPLPTKAVVSPGAILGAKSPYFALASPLKSPQIMEGCAS
ncbi:mediator of RNA polymerase II transcription subunit 1-like isoform X2 [Ornithodoros turicata]|uniref:mediator of RNA polymerase II transcription subunit 1-like isoform X2 n=1 Tax=Ornithodoros turicata TaxID=34597 RepID=UPI003139A329